MRRLWTGCGTALVTPFTRDGAVDEAGVRRLARRQIDAGMHFLVPCGTTGESPTMSEEERLRVVAGWLWSGALLVLLGFLVLYPVAMLLLGALTNTNPVVDGFGVFDISLANFITVLGNPGDGIARDRNDEPAEQLACERQVVNDGDPHGAVIRQERED